MSWNPSRQRVAKLVGLKLVGSEVEEHVPNEIHLNRFRLRCRCGEPFYALTQHIYSRSRYRAELVCQSCTPKQAPERGTPTRAPAKRCAHGFLGGVDCQECNPDQMCCAVCGTVGHESKLCPNTEEGKRRLASRRARQQAQKERERYAREKNARAWEPRSAGGAK